MRKLTVCSFFALLLIALWGAGAPSLASHEGVPVYRVSRMIESKIVNPKGTLLGIVQDIVFDDEGKISYLVLSRGSAFGVVGPMIPIPWNDAKMEPRGKKFVFVVDIEFERLGEAPGFKIKEWPVEFSHDFIRKIEQFYEHR